MGETSTLLGFASEECIDDDISQLGGQPSWLREAENAPPSLAQCRICNSYMSLLLQLNGDLPDRFPGHERRLYLWGCRRKPCRRKEGSVRVFRGTKYTNHIRDTVAPSTIKQERADIGGALFAAGKPMSSGSNPFALNNTSSSTVASSTASKNPFSTAAATGRSTETFAEKVRQATSESPAKSKEPVAPWPEETAFPSPYPKYFLDAEYEYLEPQESKSKAASNEAGSSHYSAFLDGMETGESSGGQEDKDLYESAHDKAFQKFADVISQNPEQVLRYEFGGLPLLYSNTDAIGQALAAHLKKDEGGSRNAKITSKKITHSGIGMPACQRCGASRVFEVQLTPQAIVELEADDDKAILPGEGMEWGTIIVGVCSKDCVAEDDAQVQYFEEWAGVQWEEVVNRAADVARGGGGAK